MTTEAFRLVSPNGENITGTLEIIEGRACATVFTMTDGALDPEYEGDTDMFWDGQTTVYRDGQPVLLDADGNEWLLSQCTKVPVDDDDAAADAIDDIAHSAHAGIAGGFRDDES